MLGGDLNPISGFYFPLFSRFFPGEFPFAPSAINSPALVAGLGTLDYGCAMPIDRNDLPNHLFGILDLDLSEEVIVPAIIAPLKQSRQ